MVTQGLTAGRHALKDSWEMLLGTGQLTHQDGLASATAQDLKRTSETPSIYGASALNFPSETLLYREGLLSLGY